jgi:hypothetical protein
MTDRARLEKAIRDVERELEAAKTFTAVKAAAKRLQRIRRELGELEMEAKRPAPRRPRRPQGS